MEDKIEGVRNEIATVAHDDSNHEAPSVGMQEVQQEQGCEGMPGLVQDDSSSDESGSELN